MVSPIALSLWKVDSMFSTVWNIWQSYALNKSGRGCPASLDGEVAYHAFGPVIYFTTEAELVEPAAVLVVLRSISALVALGGRFYRATHLPSAT